MADGPVALTLAVPCRTDEPSLGRTLAAARAALAAVPGKRTELLVCVNGADAQGSHALAALRDLGLPCVEVDADAPRPAPLPPATAPLTAIALLTRRAGKPIAWNVLRLRARAPVALFFDADVAFAPDAFRLLLDALDAHPAAALASGKTTCAPRPRAFERVMAAPYGVDFPNLSAQLYAARLAALPVAMPEDLIEPERWLELVVGRDAVVRVPEARVVVRLPGTLADFWKQRVRIEMGKVQLDHDYPGLATRGTVQPRGRAALASLGAADVVRLGVYLGLRTVAYAVAWWRYRRGRTAGIWRQATSTKQWDAV
jgi:hypothetical protein